MNRKFLLIQLVLIIVMLVSSPNLSAQLKPLITSIAWSPDGSLIAIGRGLYTSDEHDYSIQLLDASTLAVINHLDFHKGAVSSLDWSPNGKFLLSSGGEGSEGLGIIWDITDKNIAMLSSPYSMPGRYADLWHPSGDLVANISEGNPAVNLWNPENGDTEQSFTLKDPLGSPRTIDWNSDGTRLVTGSTKGYIVIWNISTGEQISVVNLHSNEINSLDWSEDDQFIASGSSDDTIRILNASIGTSIMTLSGHTDDVTSVAWNSDSKRLASADLEGTVRVWDTSSGTQLDIFTSSGPVYALNWNPDGTKLAYGGEGSEMITVVEPSSSVASDIKSLILRLFIQLFN